ncbi:Hypothetical predicted protein [Cloeon dipterum]|uniref:Uncharacterized protein n=1 Tax=Cloeon dipterum TaxID=197152 RepID=A0A8S1D3V9_9INSE|nr:Hypothetical predicted protein [Cloeon dipterum]
MELNVAMKNLRASDNHDDIFDDIHKLKEEESVSQEVLLNFLRKCSSKMDWLETSDILSSLIDGLMDVKINLNDFSEMYPSESDYELKVLQLFASRKATQISILEINCVVNLSENIPPQIESQMWTEITKFKNVKNLSINKHQFLLKDLMEMCKNMPNLNEIQVVIDCDSEFPHDDPQFIQEFSNSFDKIKEFMFHSPGQAMKSLEALRFSGKLAKFGIKHLPNLKWFATSGFYIDKPLAWQEMDLPSELQYLRLNAIYLEELASKFDKFPSVAALVVNWTELNDVSKNSKINKKKLKLLKKFKYLNDLCLCNLTSPEYLTVLLDNLGPKLMCLDLYNDTEHNMTINLKQIQETCPLLSHLTITVADVEGSQSMVSFALLTHLRIICSTNSSEKVCLVSNLLSPPNLEVVHLEGFQVTRQELKETTSKIKDKAILTKVDRLKLFFKGETSAKMKVALEKEGKRLKLKKYGVPNALCKEYKRLFMPIPKTVDYKEMILFINMMSNNVSSKTTLMLLKHIFNAYTWTEICFHDFMILHFSEPDFHLKVLKLITSTSQKANNVKIFSIDQVGSISSELELKMRRRIEKMTNVRVLDIEHYYVTIHDVLEICIYMPKLRDIFIKINHKSALPVNDPDLRQLFAEVLRNIKNFRYVPTGSMTNPEVKSFSETVISFIVERLPNAISVTSHECFVDMSLVCENMRGKSNLEYFELNANHLEKFSAYYDVFPAIKTLLVNWIERDYTKTLVIKEVKYLKKYEQIKHLICYDLTSTEHLEIILSLLGKKLLTLRFKYTTETTMDINLYLIYECCPMLDFLKIKATAGVYGSACLADFYLLRVLKIVFRLDSCPEVNLAQYLAAPSLEVLELRNFQAVPTLEAKIWKEFGATM